MPAPAGYTQGQIGYFWRTIDGSGPYALGPDGSMYLIAGPFAGNGLATTLQLYVATTGSDSANTGMTVGSPFRTVQKAVNIAAGYTTGMSGIVINIADGVYAEDVAVQQAKVAQSDYFGILFLGNGPAVCNVNSFYFDGAGLFKMQGINAPGGIYAYRCALETNNIQTVNIGSGLAAVFVDGIVRFSGNANFAAYCEDVGTIIFANTCQVTYVGAPVYAVAVLFASGNGSINVQGGCTFAGAPVGFKYLEQAGGSVVSGNGSLLGTAAPTSRNYGYGVVGGGVANGLGAAVTQLTSKATGVTSHTMCCDLTLNAASLAAATAVSFVYTCDKITAKDILDIAHVSGGTLAGYSFAATPANGSATITVRNNTAGALLEALVLRLQVRQHQIN